MVSGVNTGVPLQGGTVNSPGQERQSANTYFDIGSTSNISHRFSVDESPYYLKAFNLTEFGSVIVLMCTDTPAGEIMQQMFVLQFPVALGQQANFLLIDFPGIYRLQIDDSSLGIATVVGGPTALSYWSWGLAAYGAAVQAGGVIIPS